MLSFTHGLPHTERSEHGIEVGMLINFGNPRLEYKRFTRTKKNEHG